MFDLITQSMLFLLETLKTIVGGYGWAIIALTVLVRVVLWPVSRSQMRSMKMMQELQPKMKQLQERYKAEPQRLQAEMFKLYKEYKFNPLGGCLPMLIQLPLFLGLFWAISHPSFMATGDPLFLDFIHLKHSGIITHGGSSGDGEMNLATGGGGFLGGGKDSFQAVPTITVHLDNGTSFEKKVPNERKAITLLPKEPRPGIPLKVSSSYSMLGLEGYEGSVDTVTLHVINNGTKEQETLTFKPAPDKTRFSTVLDTVPGETQLNVDVLLLVIIFAVTMIASQRLMATQTPATGNEQQQQMMKFLPYMFSIFLFIFPIPAGVLLYMDTNSLFQVFQTWMFQRGGKAEQGQASSPSQAVLDIKPDTPSI